MHETGVASPGRAEVERALHHLDELATLSPALRRPLDGLMANPPDAATAGHECRSLVAALVAWTRDELGARHRTHRGIELWRHGLAVGCAAQRLALECGRADAPSVFVAGVLHDIGKVALHTLFPRSYERIAAHADRDRGEAADAERRVLGIDHTHAGRRLAERWSLPEALRDVIWLHHLPPAALPLRTPAGEWIALTQCADALARELAIGYSGNHRLDPSAEELARRLGIPAAAFAAIAADLAREVMDFAVDVGLAATPGRAALHGSRLDIAIEDREHRFDVAQHGLQALTHLGATLDARSTLADAAATIASAARIALRQPAAAVVAWNESGELTVIAIDSGAADAKRRITVAAPAELIEWRRSVDATKEPAVMPAPVSMTAFARSAGFECGEGSLWMLPIRRANALVGAVLIYSPEMQASRWNDEAGVLAALEANFGLAIARAHAQAAADRLTDELATANRLVLAMQSDLLRARALSMIAEMAAGAGHELNNPLSVISGRAQILLRDGALDAEATRSLEAICAKAHDCSRIVSELMDFARPPAPQLDDIDVVGLIDDVRASWCGESGLAISRVIIEAPPPGAAPLTARADPRQLRSVLIELLRNATEAIAENDGVIHVAARPIDGPTGAPAVEIAVRDTGRGMTPSIAQRAFDPFFSHRRAGRGRGLGLARAYRIVDAHGGRIAIDSRPGAGTTIRLILSASHAPRSPAAGGYTPGDDPRHPL